MLASLAGRAMERMDFHIGELGIMEHDSPDTSCFSSLSFALLGLAVFLPFDGPCLLTS